MKKFKKIVLILLFLFILGGCKKNKENDVEIKESEEKFVLEKEDNEKDFVYLDDYRELKFADGSVYLLQIAVINIKSDEASNVNLELSSFVKKSYKDMVMYRDVFVRGNVISYTYSETERTISVIQKYYPYIDGLLGEEKSNVYVLSKETGKVLNKEEILRMFDYSEEDFFKELESKLDSEDVLYTIMNIKNNGYELYINEEDKLVVLYDEVTEEETTRKELILK